MDCGGKRSATPLSGGRRCSKTRGPACGRKRRRRWRSAGALPEADGPAGRVLITRGVMDCGGKRQRHAAFGRATVLKCSRLPCAKKAERPALAAARSATHPLPSLALFSLVIPFPLSSLFPCHPFSLFHPSSLIPSSQFPFSPIPFFVPFPFSSQSHHQHYPPHYHRH
jgi:hypothetical protein